jgi:hypothetical protein
MLGLRRQNGAAIAPIISSAVFYIILLLLDVHFVFSFSNDDKFTGDYLLNTTENFGGINNTSSRKHVPQVHLPSTVVKPEFVTKDKKHF